MKNLVIAAIALLSISSFAKETKRDMVRVQGASAQIAFDKAQDLVVEIKGAKKMAKLSYLNNCNYTSSQAEDMTWFTRNAWTNTSSVTLNHVTGVYTAIVNVSCKK